MHGPTPAEQSPKASDGGYVIFNDSNTAGSMRPNNFGIMKIAPDTSGR
ncbi:MAG: hypothetical protein ACYSYW_07975 [Planctomycetota bacterium]